MKKRELKKKSLEIKLQDIGEIHAQSCELGALLSHNWKDLGLTEESYVAIRKMLREIGSKSMPMITKIENELKKI